ncbi:SDR family NAD(P)-dependent oxidoreductase [Umezawaea endophytica]|uniref:SDR family oxidoreductase n=1 Tax=Umezawaea endophytica TaxID=1654476 RepID=A0A9X3ADU2_9PSEU|nr:SDR family NAD(P)-dependent oxidoreductase [Umezawaea endophytica]MCS7475230.1 SDR family oxidoreductase [Umezawaea endophytica]
MTGLDNSSVIVTGGGSGIGRAAALRFAAEGARVLVADLDASRAAAVVEEIGGAAVAVVGDLGEQAVVDRVVATAVEAFGGVDVLVNNAGIMDGMTATADVTDEEWDRLIRVNLTAPFRLARAVVPHMLAKGKGAIVNTASEAALRGSAAGTAYTVSKHGVVGLTRSLAIMYRKDGIRTNAIAPGATITGIVANVDPEAHGPSTLMPYMGNFGRVSEADEQAAVIVFLASDEASNLNGVVLPVDNGWSAV